MNSPQRLRAVFDEATLRFPGLTAEDINGGKCFEWATIVFDLLEGSKIAGHSISGHGHSYIEIDSVCYDAECYEGRADWLDLPFFERIRHENA